MTVQIILVTIYLTRLEESFRVQQLIAVLIQPKTTDTGPTHRTKAYPERVHASHKLKNCDLHNWLTMYKRQAKTAKHRLVIVRIFNIFIYDVPPLAYYATSVFLQLTQPSQPYRLTRLYRIQPSVNVKPNSIKRRVIYHCTVCAVA